jgi:hypothetical protein
MIIILRGIVRVVGVAAVVVIVVVVVVVVAVAVVVVVVRALEPLLLAHRLLQQETGIMIPGGGGGIAVAGRAGGADHGADVVLISQSRQHRRIRHLDRFNLQHRLNGRRLVVPGNSVITQPWIRGIGYGMKTQRPKTS